MPVKKKMVSLVAEVLASSGNLGRQSLDEKIAVLEQTITRGRAEIAQLIEDQYAQFLPEAISDAKALKEKIDWVKKTAEQELTRIKAVVSSIPVQDAQSIVNCERQLLAVENCLAKISTIRKVADGFEEMDILPANELSLKYAQLVVETNKHLKTLVTQSEVENDEERVFSGRILPALTEELVSQRERLTYNLDEWWLQFLQFHTHPEENVLTISLYSSQIDLASQNLSALQVLGRLNDKLCKLGTILCKHFCEPLLVSSVEDSKCDRLSFETNPIVSLNERKIRLLLTDTIQQRPDPEDAIWSLTRLFDHLHAELGSLRVVIQANDEFEKNNQERFFLSLLGEKMSNELTRLIVDECLKPAVPENEEQKNADRFHKLIRSANVFQARLQEIGFLSSESQSFESFAENFETLFIDKRCQKILGDGRRLIKTDLHNFIHIGHKHDEEDESVVEFQKSFEKMMSSSEENSGVNERPSITETEIRLPKLIQFPYCAVSQSMVKFIDLIESTLRVTANEATSDKKAARFFETARNLVELYVVLTPLKHEQALASVPQVAAIFYNNCYYLSHRLSMLAFHATRNVAQALNVDEIRVTFVDYIPRLRILAADCLERQLFQRRRDLSATLVDSSAFDHLKMGDRLKKCEKMMRSCAMQLEQLHSVWSQVLTTTILLKSLGNLTEHLLTTLVQLIVSKEDIAADDAELIGGTLQRLLQSLERLFIVDNEFSEIARFCEGSYFRMKEVIFCLGASLQEISDRWCDGKGPLAQWIGPVEAKQLIRALFQNTERRAKILSRIR